MKSLPGYALHAWRPQDGLWLRRVVRVRCRATFPLYNEARKLFNHSEGMVRAAVRMLTINVYSVGDPSMLDYVASAPCNHYFHEVALHLADHALHFDRHLDALQSGAPQAGLPRTAHASRACSLEERVVTCGYMLCCSAVQGAAGTRMRARAHVHVPAHHPRRVHQRVSVDGRRIALSTPRWHNESLDPLACCANYVCESVSVALRFPSDLGQT